MGTEPSGAIDDCDCNTCELKRLRAEVARLNLVIASAVATFRQYKMSVDDYPTAGHRAFMAVIEEGSE